MSGLPGIDPDALDALFARAEKGAARAGCAVQLAVARFGTLAGFRSFGRARNAVVAIQAMVT